ncbi:Hypothetical predicted protein [Mytilus galloprovincialis]|uniref:LRRNT domain-containing protein n=1 Tax=Mytilus galloprovincialis TaxID=29158 RepID=A0A8B6H3S8_MYTGA|nr:Hypothetical predicted protein [Mytilus galloprovincialis]
MGINNRRSMGTENFTRGFEIRISRNSSLDRYKTHFCQCEESTYYLSRGRRFNRKKCNRDCTSSRDTSRFLQYTFSGSQENRRFKTCDKLETSQPVSEEATFQNGHFNKSLESSKAPRLGVVSRSERCISPYSSSQNTQKISTFLHTRQMLPICSSVFRSFSSTSSVHKNSYCSSSSSENPKHTPSNLFGRLVASECSRENANFRQRENTQSSDKFGIYSKSSKIFSYPITRDHLHRGIVQFQEGDSFSNYRKNFKVRNVSDKPNEGTQYGKRLSMLFGFDSVLHRIDPQCTPLYEAYPITSTSFLETIHQRSHLSNSIYSTPKRSFELVVGQSKHYQGQIITPVVSNPHNNNRCFKDRVWGSHEQSDFSRFLVCSRTETTHKSLGIGSCNSNSTTFPTTITKSKCATQMRQHNSRSICKQTGGHQVHTPLLQDMVSNENGYSEQSDIQSSSHSGEIKRSGRSSVSKQNTTHRVDTEQSDSSISVCNVGRTNNRFVCLVEFMLMFSLSTIHLARAQGCPNMCTCSGTAVDCSNKGLTQIPDDIPSTTTTLYLFGNSITSIEENGFKGLTSLQELFIESFPIDQLDVHSYRFLYRNSITSIEENVFMGLTSLRELGVSGNSITSVEENAFEGLTSLQTLYLDGNNITSIEENVFEGLTSLQELDLSGNSITSIAQNAFEGLTSLQNLYFNNNPLVCCSVTGFVDWVNRRLLDVFEGTCTAHNKTAILNFNTSDCIVPVDGGWSDWENSTCSVTCGDGTVTMIRECNTPVPSGGGNNCSGEPINTDSCNLGECPVDGGWSDWENSTCSVTCGDGTVNMNRECNNPIPSGGGNNCSGKSINTHSCNLGECPEYDFKVNSVFFYIQTVDGGWSDWENSTCSVTCGDGTVNMNRECNNPVPSGGGNNCSGKSTNMDSCNLGECPEYDVKVNSVFFYIQTVDGGWSDWENSTCSVTCGDGTVNMNRECNNPVPSGGGHNCSESCNTLEKELDKKSGKRSDNKSGKWSDNKSGKWSVNKSGGKGNGRNGKKEKRQNKKGNKPNRNGWY